MWRNFVVIVADDFHKSPACESACVHVMSCYRDLSASVYDWSNSESSSSNDVVADMFESVKGIVSAVGSKLMLLIQVRLDFLNASSLLAELIFKHLFIAE